MSYLGPSRAPRAPGTAPPQRADPCGPMAGRARPGAPLPMPDRAWPGAGVLADRFVAALATNRPAPAATEPVLSGLGPGFVIFTFLLARRQAWRLTRSRGSRPGRPGDCGLSHYQYWAVDLTADRAGLETQECRRRGHQRAGSKARASAVIWRKPPLNRSDPAMAADRQPAPFWANHSSTRCVMSEPRTAPAFQLTWQ